MARTSPDGVGVQLARLKKDARFRVYPTERQLSSDQSIDWSGDLGAFLDFAADAGVKTLYLSEWGEDRDEPDRDPEGDLEVGFLLDGVMHVFSTAEPDGGDEATSAGLDLRDFVKDHRSELVGEAADEILKRPDAPGFYGLAGTARSLVRRFLSQKLGVDESAIGGIHRLGEMDETPEDRSVSDLAEDIVAEVKRREKPVVEALYPDWLSFARQIGGHALGQGDLDVFLDRKNTKLTRDSRQELWTQAKADLRAERTAEKMERGGRKR